MPLWVGRTRSPSEQRDCPPLPARTHTHPSNTSYELLTYLCSAHSLFVCLIRASPVNCATDHCQIATNDLGLGDGVQCQNVVRVAGIIIQRRLSVLLVSRLHDRWLIEVLHLLGITQKVIKMLHHVDFARELQLLVTALE